MSTTDAHPPEVFELAASVAHSLNNVIAVLYAASSNLESAGNTRSLERGSRAVADACGSALCLSAALSLFALPPVGMLSIPSDGQVLHPDDIARISETLETATRIKPLLHDLNDKPVKTTLDRDTLQSFLLCAAAVLRRAAGRDAQLHCDVRRSNDSSGTAGRLEFELYCEGSVALDSKRASRDPCELALAYAVTHLPVMDARMERSRPENIRFSVDFTG